MMPPDPIDHHARGQGIVLAGDGIRQFHSAAPIGEGFAPFAREHLQELTWHLLPFVRRIAAQKYARVPLGRPVFENHRVGGCSRSLQDPAINLRLQLRQFDPC
jgi:hypothetical protein